MSYSRFQSPGLGVRVLPALRTGSPLAARDQRLHDVKYRAPLLGDRSHAGLGVLAGRAPRAVNSILGLQERGGPREFEQGQAELSGQLSVQRSWRLNQKEVERLPSQEHRLTDSSRKSASAEAHSAQALSPDHSSFQLKKVGELVRAPEKSRGEAGPRQRESEPSRRESRALPEKKRAQPVPQELPALAREHFNKRVRETERSRTLSGREQGEGLAGKGTAPQALASSGKSPSLARERSSLSPFAKAEQSVKRSLSNEARQEPLAAAPLTWDSALSRLEDWMRTPAEEPENEEEQSAAVQVNHQKQARFTAPRFEIGELHIEILPLAQRKSAPRVEKRGAAAASSFWTQVPGTMSFGWRQR